MHRISRYVSLSLLDMLASNVPQRDALDGPWDFFVLTISLYICLSLFLSPSIYLDLSISISISVSLVQIEKWNDQAATPAWTGVSESGPARVDHGPYGPWTDAKILAKHAAKH